MKTVEFNGYLLTNDEAEVLEKTLKEIREKKELENMIHACEAEIALAVYNSINAIGIPETKKLVRTIMRRLRELE